MTIADPDEKPLDPEQQKMISRVRLLMLVSGFATVLGIAVVVSLIGYRFYKSGGSTAPSEVTATLPRGAKITGTAVADGQVAVTLDVNGTVEVRTFDLKTLRPTGRLRFANEP